ncbi:MAG: hypothetical protein WCI84_10975, partial [Bacteroidota bacterium]
MQNTESLDLVMNEIDSLFIQQRYTEVIAAVSLVESKLMQSIDDLQLSGLEVIKGFSQLNLNKCNEAMLSFENALNL